MPDYFSLRFDVDQLRIGSLPQRDNMNHYHTYALLYEFERAAGLWRQEERDYWTVQDRWFGGKVAFQDPYRRAVFGRTAKALFRGLSDIDRLVADGIRTAEVVVLTLGLTEVWLKRDNGRASCMNPGYARGGGFEGTAFHASTLHENAQNMRRLVQIAGELNPSARLVLTVSPVPLGSTHTEDDVLVANERSKSILRAVAGQMADEFAHVAYFPAYEILSGAVPRGRAARS